LTDQEGNMIYSNTTLIEKTAVLKSAIGKSEALIIGVGADLSSVATPLR
jgi:hypothetical protein